jgi:superfamily II DNA or RNA helicase
VLVAPTGFGKTHTTTEIVRSAVERGRTVWFMAHLKEILQDTHEKLRAHLIPHGFIMAGHAGSARQVQIVSVQTAVRRLDKLKRPDLIIVDEAHLAVAATYQRIFEWAEAGPRFYRPGGAMLLHLTATPERLDGRGLGEVADVIVPTCSTADLISEGLLAPIRYFAPDMPDLRGIRMVAGDYDAGQLADFMDKPKIVGSAVGHYKRLAMHRPTIAYCVSIRHAEHTAAEFRAAGVRAVAVSGESDSAERREALEGLRAGRIDVVCNCALWVAGVDAPNVACIVLLAPTRSLTKYLQSVGRGLRIAPGKPDTVILDHANLAMTHGLPTDEREWSLTGHQGAKRSKAGEVSVRQCSACYAVSRATASVCRECGKPFPIGSREIEQVDGELTEIEVAQQRRQAKVEQGAADSLEALTVIGKMRGYKNPAAWARYVWAARQAKRRA